MSPSSLLSIALLSGAFQITAQRVAAVNMIRVWWCFFLLLHNKTCSHKSDAVDEAARKEARSTVPLESSFEPAVLALLVHKHYVSFLQLQLSLALRRVGHYHTVPLTHNWPAVMLHG